MSVTLHVATDGTVTFGPIDVNDYAEGMERAPTWQLDWRASVIDLLMEGRIADAEEALQNCKKDPFDDVERDPHTWSLGVITVESEARARILRASLCRLEREEHPWRPGERWYRLSRFDGSVEDLIRVTQEFENLNKRLQETEDERRSFKDAGAVDRVPL